jgi:hypothetical protein
MQRVDFSCFLTLLRKTFAFVADRKSDLQRYSRKVIQREHNRLPFIKLVLSGNSSMELDLLDLLGYVDPGGWEFAQLVILVSPFSRILTKFASPTQAVNWILTQVRNLNQRLATILGMNL